MINLNILDINNNIKRTILVSFFISIGAQFHINLFLTNFKISFAIILLPIFIYFLGSFNVALTTLLSSLGVFFLRIIVHFLTTGSFDNSISAYSPEIFFYIFYGLSFNFYIKTINYNLKNKFFLLNLMIIDYFSNFIEGFIRVGTIIFSFKVQESIILVAIIRSLLVYIVFVAIDYYSIILLKKEHAERYKKLLWVTAKLKGEVFWMEKNMHTIENIMSTSYGLFEKISKNTSSDTWANDSLIIAKDIHEIKKEYYLVVRGIKEALEDNLNDNGIYFEEIIKILQISMIREISSYKKNISLSFSIERNFFTSKHYFLMSILRNLIINSIESITDDRKHYINVIHYTDEGNHIFKVKDDGLGIKSENLNYIFSPGYSTKINYETGEINRGLGLSLVKDIITDELQGSIDVTSLEGIGTTFLIYIPKNILEES